MNKRVSVDSLFPPPDLQQATFTLADAAASGAPSLAAMQRAVDNTAHWPLDSIREMRTQVTVKADGDLESGIQMSIDAAVLLKGMGGGLPSLSTGERVAALRAIGAAVRRWAPEAADYLESYDED